MNFTLFYSGRIPSANSSTLKKIDDIRRGMSPQIRSIFDYAPLSEYPIKLERDDNEDDDFNHFNLHREVNGQSYTCLINEKLGLACRLKIVFFETKGTLSVSNQIGDVDNKLKPLLDALSLPKSDPSQYAKEKESLLPAHCLLQDDSLVWGISVQRRRLLARFQNGSETVTQIEVEVIPVRGMVDTLGLFGVPVF